MMRVKVIPTNFKCTNVETRQRRAVAQAAKRDLHDESTITADPAAFAEAKGIQLQVGAALLKLIGQRTPEQQAALLAVAHEGEYWKPTCASCGIKTVEREHKRDGNKFWGCSNYPKCKTTFATRSA